MDKVFVVIEDADHAIRIIRICKDKDDAERMAMVMNSEEMNYHNVFYYVDEHIVI